MTTEEMLREAADLLADVPVDPGVCARCVHSWCVGRREREKARVQWLAAYEAHKTGTVGDIREAEERGAVRERDACEKIARDSAAMARLVGDFASLRTASTIVAAIAARGKDGR